MERAQNQINHFRQILDKRIIANVQAATKTSKALRTTSEVMVGLTALLFLFVMGFIIKRRVLRPVVRLSVLKVLFSHFLRHSQNICHRNAHYYSKC